MDVRRFLEELKRRRVVRAALAYAAALFLVLQVADIVVPALGLAGSVMTGLVVIGALGFPLALVLAWAVDITPAGVERTSGRVDGESAPSESGRGTGRTALAIAAAAGVVAASAWWATRPSEDAASPSAQRSSGSIRSLAVLPLTNLTGADDQLHVVDGMHDLLIGELSRIENLSVISQRSVLRFRDSELPMGAIADTLGVQALVEGSVFRHGDSVRVTARLVQPRPETYLWREEYGGRLSEAMALQARVARAVADAIRITLTEQTEAHLAREVPGVDPAAMDAYLLARAIWKARDPARMQLAIETFERAVELDPGFALGWAGVADGYTVGAGYDALDISREEAARRATAAVDSALRLEPGLLEALAARGGLRLYLEQDFRGAERDLSRVVELSPSSAQAHDWLGDALGADGRVEEALAHYRRAVELDPLSALLHRDYARGLYQNGNCEAAIRQAERSLQLDPDHLPAADLLVRCKLVLGEDEEAITEYLAYLAESDWGTRSDLEALRSAWLAEGRNGFLLEDARQMTEAMHILAAGRYAEAGAHDLAFEQIFASLEDREALVIGLRADPAFRNLQADPRWEEVLRRLDALAENAPP